MSRLCRRIPNDRYLQAGTAAGRQGIFLDSNALPPLQLERLRIPPLQGGAHTPRLPGRSEADGTAPLTLRQKKLVLAILKKTGDCGKQDVREFVGMHPGVRALRYRNYESSLWTDGSWKKELGRLIAHGKRLPSGFERADLIEDEIYAARVQFGSICFDLGASEPSQSEKIEALMQAGELAKSQAAFFRKAAAEDGITQEEVDDFKSWAGGLGPEKLRHAWRRMEPNAVTVASIAHKLRFQPEPFTSDEESILHGLAGGTDVSADDLRKLEAVFSGNMSLYGGMMQKITNLTGNPAEPILEAARASSEFDTLLDFLEMPHEQFTIRLSKSPGFTKPHSEINADHPDNDDTLTSISLSSRRASGETYHADLDIVFDGVSGHGGASMASRIAKDAFEISALAGWMRSPEDVRFVTQLADLAIDLEKERIRLLAGHASGEEKMRLKLLQGMGTTMAASYIEGDRFYGIHCGDSDFKVVRNGAVVFKSTPHGVGNTIWAGLGIGTRAIQINNEDTGFKPFGLEDGDAVLTFTDGIGDVTCDHEHGSLASAHANDAAALSAAIVITADSRKDGYSTYTLGCSCEEIGGKDDDMTLIARFVGLSAPGKKS